MPSMPAGKLVRLDTPLMRVLHESMTPSLPQPSRSLVFITHHRMPKVEWKHQSLPQWQPRHRLVETLHPSPPPLHLLLLQPQLQSALQRASQFADITMLLLLQALLRQTPAAASHLTLPPQTPLHQHLVLQTTATVCCQEITR